MVERPRLIGPLPDIGARRASWDRSGRVAITLTADNRFVGLTVDEDVWDVPAHVAPSMAWDPAAPLLAVVGGSILVDGSGAARVDPSGADLLLSPSAQLLASHRDPHGVVIRSADGTVVSTQPADRASWHPAAEELLIVDGDGIARLVEGSRIGIVDDDLERGPLFARWSTAGTGMVTWGQYGPFDVRDEAGVLLRSFPAHLGRSNLASVVGGTVLVSAGDDRLLVVHDVLRGAVHGSLDIRVLPVRLDLDPSERFVAVTTVDNEVMVIDVQLVEQVQLARPASWARWSTIGTSLACCDGADLWLQTW